MNDIPLLQVMALVVLAFGIYALVDGASFADLVNAASPDASVNLYDTAVILIIIVATFIMIVSFFGCCGAWKVRSMRMPDLMSIFLAGICSKQYESRMQYT